MYIKIYKIVLTTFVRNNVCKLCKYIVKKYSLFFNRQPIACLKISKLHNHRKILH